MAGADEGETVDWFITLQKEGMDLWGWQQFILPDWAAMRHIEEGPILSIWHAPQGVRANRTPRMSRIRLRS